MDNCKLCKNMGSIICRGEIDSNFCQPEYNKEKMENLIEKLIGREVSILINGKITKGIVRGSKLSYAKVLGIEFSWEAVNNAICNGEILQV
jgi:hypothetical protein